MRNDSTTRVKYELGDAIASAAALIESWPVAERIPKFRALLQEMDQKPGLTELQRAFWKSTMQTALAWHGLWHEVSARAARRREAEAALAELLGRKNGD